ncbi:MAG: YihY/virulence factor BrkB family protein [Eubacteriales bacterium]|nr:YihY/virulence factor BrkB family protein [Eubacteriales bacterium]
MKRAGRLLRQIHLRCIDDSISMLGAGFAYYLMLAFLPFLVFLANLATFTPLANATVLEQLSQIMPRDAYGVVTDVLADIMDGNRVSALVVSAGATLLASSNGFIAIMRGLNKAYDVKETRNFWVTRGLSLIFTALVALLLLVNVVLIVFGERILAYVEQRLHVTSLVVVAGHLMRVALPLALIFVILALLYRHIPNHRLPFRYQVPGALFAAVVWVVSSLVFSFYVERFTNYSLAYGSLGGVIILIVWLYLSSAVLLVGSEINAALALRRHKAGMPEA